MTLSVRSRKAGVSSLRQALTNVDCLLTAAFLYCFRCDFPLYSTAPWKCRLSQGVWSLLTQVSSLQIQFSVHLLIEKLFDNEREVTCGFFTQLYFKSLHVFSRECDDHGPTVESQHSREEY